MQPGQTITPGDSQQPPEEPKPQTVEPSAAEAVQWQYTDSETSIPMQAPQSAEASVSWSASEYVAHQKTLGWFIGLGLIIAALAIGIYIFTHGIFSPLMIVLCGFVFGVFAARQPRVLQYVVDHRGLTIGGKFYSYDNFKSFSVVEEGPLHSILLAPLQRFMPPISIYYDPSDEDRILAVLGDYLPFAEVPRDAVDSLMRRVRF